MAAVAEERETLCAEVGRIDENWHGMHDVQITFGADDYRTTPDAEPDLRLRSSRRFRR